MRGGWWVVVGGGVKIVRGVAMQKWALAVVEFAHFGSLGLMGVCSFTD